VNHAKGDKANSYHRDVEQYYQKEYKRDGLKKQYYQQDDRGAKNLTHIENPGKQFSSAC
jgi:hypothetical protein